jgi:hypothetical protein
MGGLDVGSKDNKNNKSIDIESLYKFLSCTIVSIAGRNDTISDEVVNPT